MEEKKYVCSEEKNMDRMSPQAWKKEKVNKWII